MEITREKSGDLLVLRLQGRLDANWSGHVQNALAGAVRDGEHRVHLDMSAVAYVSSAGLRVLLASYKQLKGINGFLGITRPSAEVRSVLELAGLDLLIAVESAALPPGAQAGEPFTSAGAAWETYQLPPLGGAFRLAACGDPDALRRGTAGADSPRQVFGAGRIALGVGALGASVADCAPRFGELLAVDGLAAFQPSDGSSRPDFVVSEGALRPEGRLVCGLTGEGRFPLLARFEANRDKRMIPLAEVARTALSLAGTPVAVFVALTETAGLVGAALRQSPAPAATPGARFAFPEIRDWLSFTSERAHRDSTSLLVGVVARPETSFAPLLRPLGSPDLQAHIHAAAFPYRPLRKGPIDLHQSVRDLFESQGLQAVLHLLADRREFNGAGDSEFHRGAVWVAPVLSA